MRSSPVLGAYDPAQRRTIASESPWERQPDLELRAMLSGFRSKPNGTQKISAAN